MGYDIIEQVIELSVAGSPLGEKLESVAKLLAADFHFDQGSIYLKDPSTGRFEIRAFAGAPSERVDSYGEHEGLPGQVLRKGAHLEIYKRSADEGRWESIEDRGLKGFKSAFACPLKIKGEVYGVIYLKARRKAVLTAVQRHMLRAAVLQVMSVIKCNELLQDHRRVHFELQDALARLKNSERLMVIGDMAASIAHEIKNPLLSIGGYAVRLKKHLGQDPDSLPYVEQMFKEISRIEKMMNGIVKYSDGSAIELRPEDLNSVIEEALSIFEDECRTHGITLVREFAEGPLDVMAEKEQLKIAFDNLIANAVQSMETGGRLVLSTSRIGETVMAEVRDTGGGIGADKLRYIFNPFFTTKEHGTGLGLPITKSIITRHRGIIEVRSEAGAGAVFTVKLPSARKNAA